MASSWKMMELYIASAKRLAVQYLAVRRFRRVIAVLVILLCCAVIYLHLRVFRYQKTGVQSAIGCKSKIAQVATFAFMLLLSLSCLNNDSWPWLSFCLVVNIGERLCLHLYLA